MGRNREYGQGKVCISIEIEITKFQGIRVGFHWSKQALIEIRTVLCQVVHRNSFYLVTFRIIDLNRLFTGSKGGDVDGLKQGIPLINLNLIQRGKRAASSVVAGAQFQC